MQTLIDQIRAARAVSTPLLAVTTPDQAAVIQELVEKIKNGGKEPPPIVAWDRARGIKPKNEQGRDALNELCDKVEDLTVENLEMATANPSAAMRAAYDLPKETVLLAQGMDRFLNEPDAGELIQAVLNLRDVFKSDLPTDEQYATVVTDLYEAADLKKPKKEHVKLATRSVRGLSSFEAEQVLAMSLAMGDGLGIDLSDAWEMKRRAVSKVKGLTMTLDGPALSDLRGLDAIIGRLNKLHNGPHPPELYVRVDEMDKGLAGLGEGGGPGDNTGVSQDLHEQFLTNMEDNEWLGFILAGIRGAGKTVLTQAIGAAHGVPTIAMDTGAMKGRHVGDSEQAFRDAFRTVKSIAGKRVCVLATCNKLSGLPPELLRRFEQGIWFFDLLSKAERAALWPVYLKKYDLDLKSELPSDEGWTGAEIRNCCRTAYLTGDTVAEVGNTGIVPVSRSDPKSVDLMKSEAESKGFLSASYEGAYRRSSVAEVEPEQKKRKLTIKSGASAN
jgi:hypothetical protein